MFLFQKIIGDFRSRDEAWEHARDKYLEDNEYASEYSYQNNHPRPGRDLLTALKVIALGIIIVVTFSTVIYEIVTTDHPSTPTKPVSAYKNGEECGGFKIGDLAVIQYGDYQGAEVKIVGGCGAREDYQTVTIKNQTLFGPNSDSPNEIDKPIEPGLTIPVDSGNNLSTYGHSKT